jgi:hypothetical protein
MQELKTLSSLVRALGLGDHGLPLRVVRENYLLVGASPRSTFLTLRGCADV